MINHHILAILAGLLTLLAVYVRAPLVAVVAVILMFFYAALALGDLLQKISGLSETLQDERKKLKEELKDVQRQILEKPAAIDARLVETTAAMLIEAAHLSRNNDLLSIRQGLRLVAEVRNRITP